MNKEDYVSLGVAKLLKEKGYDKDCNTFIVEECWGFNKGELRCVDKDRELCSCPTLYDAAKWLRENHNIHLDVRCTAYCKPLNRHDYMCEVFALSCNIFSDTKVYHKYEETLNAGIFEALKLI